MENDLQPSVRWSELVVLESSTLHGLGFEETDGSTLDTKGIPSQMVCEQFVDKLWASTVRSGLRKDRVPQLWQSILPMRTFIQFRPEPLPAVVGTRTYIASVRGGHSDAYTET